MKLYLCNYTCVQFLVARLSVRSQVAPAFYSAEEPCLVIGLPERKVPAGLGFSPRSHANTYNFFGTLCCDIQIKKDPYPIFPSISSSGTRFHTEKPVDVVCVGTLRDYALIITSTSYLIFSLSSGNDRIVCLFS